MSMEKYLTEKEKMLAGKLYDVGTNVYTEG